MVCEWGLIRVDVSIRHKRTSRTPAGPGRAWRQPLRRAPPPPAAAPPVSTWRATVAAGAGRHLARILALHSLAGYTWLHITAQAVLVSGRQRAGSLAGRAPRISERGAILRDCGGWPIPRRRRAGAVTGATFASARSHPVTRLTRDARKTIATQPTTSRTISVCDDMQRPLTS